MNTIDTVILITVGIFFLMGFIRGFIREMGAFVGFFVSLWIAGQHYGLLVQQIKPSLTAWPLIADPVSTLISYFAVFIISQFVIGFFVRILDFMVRRLSPVPFLKTTNRLAGGAVGICEGVLFLGAILYVLTAVPFSQDLTKKLDDSRFSPIVLTTSKLLTPFLPKMDQFAPAFLPGVKRQGGAAGSQAGSNQYTDALKQLDALKKMDWSKINEKNMPAEFGEIYKQFQQYEKQKNQIQKQ